MALCPCDVMTWHGSISTCGVLDREIEYRQTVMTLSEKNSHLVLIEFGKRTFIKF
jgi:hypothetical protein